MANALNFHSPRLKVSRAKYHLDEFRSACSAFAETQPYELFDEIDQATGEYVHRIRILRDIPGELSTIVGDVVHNLRSALDQTVCALVRENRRQVSKSNAFPVAPNAAKFEEACVGRLKNVSEKAANYIRQLKPYQGGTTELWVLSELDNMDKHNEIVPVAAGHLEPRVQVGLSMLSMGPDGGMYLGFPPPEVGAVPLGFEHGFMIPEGAKTIPNLTDGCEVYRSKLDPQLVLQNVDVIVKITFGKTAATNNEIIVELLEKLVQLVEKIVNEAEAHAV